MHGTYDAIFSGNMTHDIKWISDTANFRSIYYIACTRVYYTPKNLNSMYRAFRDSVGVKEVVYYTNIFIGVGWQLFSKQIQTDLHFDNSHAEFGRSAHLTRIVILLAHT